MQNDYRWHINCCVISDAMGAFCWSRSPLVLPDRWYSDGSRGQRDNMPLLNHLICQGHIMVPATCRTADQTPSRISGERSVTQNKLLERPTSVYSCHYNHCRLVQYQVLEIFSDALNCRHISWWQLIVDFACRTHKEKQHLFRFMKVLSTDCDVKNLWKVCGHPWSLISQICPHTVC